MKKTKLLLTPCVAISAICPFTVSCGPQGLTAERVANDIFNPSDIEEKVKPKTENLFDELKTLSEREMQDELIYDLFMFADKSQETFGNNSIKKLYKEGIIEMQTNITKCSLRFQENDDTSLIANFLGYVSFVFVKDCQYDLDWKQNDFIMATYDLHNLKVTYSEKNEWALHYEDIVDIKYCIGFYKIKSNGGTEQHLLPIISTDTGDWGGLPPNSHNWQE